MSTKTNVILIILLSVLILLPFIFMGVLSIIPEGMLPYDMIGQFFLFDHIKYNGEDYYLIDNEKVSDDLDPDTSNKIQVYYVNADGEPYDKDRTEECWGIKDDPDCNYIFYHQTGLYFTKIKELAESP